MKVYHNLVMLDIMIYPAKILRKVASPVTSFDNSLKELAQEMFTTMQAAAGVGLAAVQVNEDKSLFVMRAEEQGYLVFINPKITYLSPEKELSEEGCLSIPGVYGILPRSKKIHLKYQDLEGKTHKETIKGFPAIICQHEVDHLNGVLFIDKAEINKGKEVLVKMEANGK